MVTDIIGGGACESWRWVLREYSAIVITSSDAHRVLVSGIVADTVSAVRVGNVPVYLRKNAFLTEIGRDDSPVPFITTLDGEREVRFNGP